MALNDLGDVGPAESSAVTYTWNLIDNIAGVVIWIPLILVFVLFKDNRNGRALAILIPLFVVNVLWLAIKKMTGMPSSSAVMFNVMFNSFTIGLAIAWLLSHKFARLNRFGIFVLTLIVMALIYVLGIFSFSGLKFDQEAIIISVFFGVITTATLLSFALAGCLCRRRYTPARFMLWLAVWCVVISVVAMFVYLAVAFIAISATGGSISLGSAIVQIPLVGLIVGAILYILLLPYMILVLTNDLFRQRFYGCFRLKGMAAPAVAESQDQPGAWNIG